MNSYYKKIRYEFQQAVKEGKCWCVLSGLHIDSLKQLSLEHYCPKSRIEWNLAKSPENIYPALKVINNVKGSLLGCEWEYYKEELLQKAIKKEHNTEKKRILQAALDNIPYYKIIPCKYCVINNQCIYSQKTY